MDQTIDPVTFDALARLDKLMKGKPAPQSHT